ncbi:DapH/DapD/GlmU-related protein [Novosphingobium sp. B-7]|uniref:acyltransferase n=1 Tax=Novosphingobium sp. B-7 TaxID=1298855 RepID=UPI0003B5874A|nr:acyltransferase [Novosphingobium sp. B-7]
MATRVAPDLIASDAPALPLHADAMPEDLATAPHAAAVAPPRHDTSGRLARWITALQPRNRLATLATRLALRRRGIVPGHRFFVHGHRPRLIGKGHIRIGARVNLRGDVAPVRIEVARGAVVTLADRAFLNTGVQVICHSAIEIGPHCRIGPDCVLCDTNHHPVHQGDKVRVAPIRLGRNVWLGRGVIVLPGVTIGDHAVVAAGAVVTQDIPAAQVWRGNPASFAKAVRCAPDFIRP